MLKNKYTFIGFLTILSILLCACSGNKEEIKIDKKNSLSTIFIQKVVDNSSSEEMTKIVKDKKMVKKILSMVEGLKVKKSDSQYIFDEMKTQNTYSFNFFESEKIQSGKKVPYAFYVLNDGTFVFTHNDVGSIKKTRITIDKHKDLFSKMKQLLEINF
ncbi:hypothetical protein [Heyndrickxia sporothermodurans]|uniref:hypothetical protein n=1 Tax=Heyndrickxia sporothermodurans TaxID=46224 RepID=UPI002E225963|nr:hypothetical protein [Heyndrickxia sporothermodurans]MED3696779.1 hypothetical protein [Heyndrickxia sporothermodurans]